MWRLAPLTVAGPMAAAATTLVATGLDMGEALARAPEGLDRARLKHCLTAIEAGRLSGQADSSAAASADER